MDKRHVKSEGRLHAAILQLASREHINALSVTRVASTAGVNRSTFYMHAATPLALLEAAVQSTLTATVRAATEGIEPRDTDAVFRATVLALFELMQDQSGLYRIHLSPHSSELQPVLSDFLTSALLKTRAPTFRNPLRRQPDHSDAAIALAAFIAAGTVAVLRAWLNQQSPEQSILDAALDQLLPMWFATAEATPRPVLRPAILCTTNRDESHPVKLGRTND